MKIDVQLSSQQSAMFVDHHRQMYATSDDPKDKSAALRSMTRLLIVHDRVVRSNSTLPWWLPFGGPIVKNPYAVARINSI